MEIKISKPLIIKIKIFEPIFQPDLLFFSFNFISVYLLEMKYMKKSKGYFIPESPNV